MIQMVLLPRFGMKADIDYDPSEDWEEDREEVHPVLNYEAFFKALFKIPDLWCDGVEAAEYSNLINALLEEALKRRNLWHRLLKKFGFQDETKNEWKTVGNVVVGFGAGAPKMSLISANISAANSFISAFDKSSRQFDNSSSPFMMSSSPPTPKLETNRVSPNSNPGSSKLPKAPWSSKPSKDTSPSPGQGLQPSPAQPQSPSCPMANQRPRLATENPSTNLRAPSPLRPAASLPNPLPQVADPRSPSARQQKQPALLSSPIAIPFYADQGAGATPSPIPNETKEVTEARPLVKLEAIGETADLSPWPHSGTSPQDQAQAISDLPARASTATTMPILGGRGGPAVNAFPSRAATAAEGKRVSSNGQRVSSNGQRVSSNGQRVSSNGQRVSSNGQRVSSSGHVIDGMWSASNPPQGNSNLFERSSVPSAAQRGAITPLSIDVTHPGAIDEQSLLNIPKWAVKQGSTASPPRSPNRMEDASSPTNSASHAITSWEQAMLNAQPISKRGARSSWAGQGATNVSSLSYIWAPPRKAGDQGLQGNTPWLSITPSGTHTRPQQQRQDLSPFSPALLSPALLSPTGRDERSSGGRNRWVSSSGAFDQARTRVSMGGGAGALPLRPSFSGGTNESPKGVPEGNRGPWEGPRGGTQNQSPPVELNSLDLYKQAFPKPLDPTQLRVSIGGTTNFQQRFSTDGRV